MLRKRPFGQRFDLRLKNHGIFVDQLRLSNRLGWQQDQATALSAGRVHDDPSLPDNLADSATAQALRAVGEIDLSELESVEPPPGFGRD